ncbi:MAG: nicotinamide riboside transporter PnuC [Thermaurantimonas sp.]|uniref:nicotinamide riboside transporter PnuC n=1 Tax=Thermaurantimonas sp. TaxID=2681568 RepID=UPI003919D9CD
MKIKLLEAVAVCCSLLYTWLLADGNMACWWFAIVGSMIYVFITFSMGLVAEAVLHFFYLLTAIYGLFNRGSWVEEGVHSSLTAATHASAIAILGILTLISGHLLQKIKGAAVTYLDSFTTLFSFWATWLMVNFYPENWLYWIVIDAASVVLYLSRRLYLSSLLFFFYTLLAIRGWLLWTQY